jgi:hypothetical protein
MYWWKVSKLAQDFREGRVEEKERFKYYLATTILWTLGTQPFLYYGSTFKIADLISAAATVTVTIVGIFLCYRANKNGDNTDFIGRIICLGWPIAIRLVALFSALTLIFLALADIGAWAVRSDFDVTNEESIWEIGGVLLMISFYWLLYKYVTLIAHAKEAENSD